MNDYKCYHCKSETLICKDSTTECPDCTYRSLLGCNVMRDKSEALLTFKTKAIPSFECSLCGSTFKSKESLSHHNQRHHNKLACPSCKKVMRNKRSFLLHKQLHIMVVCPICTFECEKKDLEKHKRQHADYRPFECHLCDYKARKNDQLSKHLFIHSVLRPYICHICNLSFKARFYLISHLKTHTNIKPHKCPYCPHQSRRRNDLKTHIKIHSNIKDVMCDLCDFKCRTTSQLSNHRKTFHTEHSYLISNLGDKIKKCPDCEFTCKTNKDMISHLTVHSKIKTICKICNLLCKNKKQLLMHTKSHYPKEKSKVNISSSSLEPVKLFRCSDCHFVTGKEHFMIKHAISKFHTISVAE